MTKLLGYSVATLLGLAFVAVTNNPNTVEGPGPAGTADSVSTHEPKGTDAGPVQLTDFPATNHLLVAQLDPVPAPNPPNQDALERLRKALAALEAARSDPQASAPALQQAREELEKARAALAGKDSCCKEFKPTDCPPVKDCVEQDACLIVRLPPIEYSRPTYTSRGAYGFVTIFSAAAARGVENATIRAMNATKVCPSCKSTEHKPGCTEP